VSFIVPIPYVFVDYVESIIVSYTGEIAYIRIFPALLMADGILIKTTGRDYAKIP